jgi:hypothetical protein
MSHVIGPADDNDRARWADLLRRIARSYRGHPNEKLARRNLRRNVWLEIVPPGSMPDGQVSSYQIGRRHFSRMTSATLAQLAAQPVTPPPLPEDEGLAE